MANVNFTQLPTVSTALPTDIIAAVQGGITSQETLGQVANLMISQTILNYAGNPNGNVAGTAFQFCWDTLDNLLYICILTGTASSAIWKLASSSISGLVTPQYGGTGVSNPIAFTLPIAEGSGNFHFAGPLTNGQLLIGTTAADPVAANLIAGSNITITNAPGSITIAATVNGGGYVWSQVTTATNIVASNAYVANDGSLLIFTLPATASVGDSFRIVGKGAGGWKVVQNSPQQIIFGSSSTTITTGYLASTNQNDCVELVCTTANSIFTVDSVIGNITVV